MINQQYARKADADAQQDFLTGQINLFLFDLKNEASEHGFRTGETWALQLVTETEIVSLKKQHKPVVSLRLQPESLLRAFHQIKDKLNQPLDKNEVAFTATDLDKDEKRHLVAYPVRHIR